MITLLGKKFTANVPMKDGSTTTIGPYEIVKVTSARISYTDGTTSWAGETRRSIHWMGAKGFLKGLESGYYKYV